MQDLPSGTVTFLFTDIEGSTRLLRELGNRYGEILAEQAHILRTAFEEHRGREIDTQGDSFFAAFPTAKDAAAAALDAQQALASHAWPDGTRPRVRMGMHTGEPAVRDGRYVGLAVHRAARICSAAHGGQVLLSSTTSDLVADDLSPGTSLNDLGEQRLKDFDRPERVFQLVVDGLPADFPPLTTSELPAAVQTRRRRPWDALLSFGIWPWALGLGIVVVVSLVSVLRGGGEARPSPVSSRSLAIIDPATNEVSGSLRLGFSPSALVQADGAVWAANAGDKTLVRLDAKTRRRVGTVGLGSTPAAVVSTPGAVWILAKGYPHAALLRVIPGTNDVSTVARTDCCDGFGFMARNDGALWVSASDEIKIQRYDVERERLTRAFCCSVQPDALAFGEGALWAVERYDEQVTRLDPETGAIEAEIPIGAPRPPGGTFGPNPVLTGAVAGEGSVWVVDSMRGEVWQIDPVRNSVRRTIDVGPGARFVTLGFGFVWVANPTTGMVIRIDPSGRVVKRIKVAAHVGDLVKARRSIWVAVP
jgi:class 3 adenylate cyclase/streptogramin lyase